ncbi:MAG: glycosyltransferase family 2 protein, partial [Phaeodactylibacter sp.]|nr:glycosyltransferase family 2 protein [Phaeodactylibacter sp.]
LEQAYPQDCTEVFFIDGGSTDGTIAILEDYANRYPAIHLLNNPARFVPTAMNIGIRAASGEIIIRMDAHAGYPPDYVSQLVDWLQKTEADNVGGLWHTAPRTAQPKAEAIALALAHPFGVGNSLFRIGVEEPTEVDTVPFGCYRKSVFERFGYYDERLQRNQDIELNKRIRQLGGRILLIPHISCTYYARDTYKGLWRNNFQTGRWVVLTSWFTKNLSALSLRHFVPMAFVAYLLLLLVLGIGSLWGAVPPLFLAPALVPLLLHFLLCAYFSFTISRQEAKRQLFPYLFAAFWVLHLSYGSGSFSGFLELFRGKSRA